MTSNSLTSPDDNVLVQSGNNNASAVIIKAAADPGNLAAITIESTLGESVLDGAAAIQLKAPVGGIHLKSGIVDDAAVRLDASAGGVQVAAAGALELNSSGGVIGIGNEDHDGNINIGINGGRTITIGSGTATTAIGGGISTPAAQDWDLLDHDESALSFDAPDKAGILEIVTTNDGEQVKMSGGLVVTGNVAADGGLDVAGAALTITNQAITQTTGGQVTFAGNVAADGGLDVTGNTVITGGTVTVGTDGSGTDVILYSETVGDNFTWDAGEEKLVITGTAAANALEVADGNVVFADDATVKAALKVGAGGDEFSITESGDNITLASLLQDFDMDFKVNDGGTPTEVFRLDGSESSLLMNTGKKIEFGSSVLSITDLDILGGGQQVINIAHDPNGGVSLDGNTKAGQLRLYEPTHEDGNRTYVAIQAGVGNQDNTTPVVLTLPFQYPSGNGMVLKSTTSGLLTWGNDETEEGATNDDTNIGVGSGGGEVKLIFNGTAADGTISWPNGAVSYTHLTLPTICSV